MGESVDNRKIVIWGTGKIAERFCAQIQEADICCFVDNNKDRMGKMFHHREIMDPERLKGRKEAYFVIIASSYYTDICRQLCSYGYCEWKDFVSYSHVKNLREAYETELLENIRRFREKGFYGRVLLFFYLTEYGAKEKGLGAFFEKLHESLQNKLLFMQETAELGEEKTRAFLDVPCWGVPRILGRDHHACQGFYFIRDGRPVRGEYASEEQIGKITADRELNILARGLRLKYPQMAESFEYLITDLAVRYVEELIDCAHPKAVILWNEFYAMHGIICRVCMRKKVPVRYIEFGNIPGTIQFDAMGQMGESWIARRPEQFLGQPVGEDDLAEAERVWKFLYESRLNRKEQPDIDIRTQLGAGLEPGKPVIVYAGQNDFESGIQPYTEKTREFHSPAFCSSNEAALYLYGLCRRRGWNFIYKPHPILIDNGQEFTQFPEGLIILKSGDINVVADMADVLVTILSTTAYVSLVRGKATLMLGYTQLRGQGCTYEAFERDMVEGQLERALQYGFCREQKRAFLRHLALLNKYYLYRNVGECFPGISYGRELEDFSLSLVR